MMLDGIDGTSESITVKVNLGSSGKVIPPKNNKIALIDADTIVFGSCVSFQEEEYLLDKEHYSVDEWNAIILTEGYNEANNCISRLNLDGAMQSVLNKLDGILEATGCLTWELHFTSGRDSFRYTLVDSEYKANRVDDPTKVSPSGLYELKNKLVEEFPYKAFMHKLYEADDIVVAKKRALPDRYILCAVDKDVLYTLPTTDIQHFNYYSRPEYIHPKSKRLLPAINMMFIQVSELDAMKHHYKQVLTGDTGDNVIGLKGIGPAMADKALSHCTTHRECWKTVLRLYVDKGRGPFDAIKNMRLVNMHQVSYIEDTDSYELNLWKPEEDSDE